MDPLTAVLLTALGFMIGVNLWVGVVQFRVMRRQVQEWKDLDQYEAVLKRYERFLRFQAQRIKTRRDEDERFLDPTAPGGFLDVLRRMASSGRFDVAVHVPDPDSDKPEKKLH